MENNEKIETDFTVDYSSVDNRVLDFANLVVAVTFSPPLIMTIIRFMQAELPLVSAYNMLIYSGLWVLYLLRKKIGQETRIILLVFLLVSTEVPLIPTLGLDANWGVTAVLYAFLIGLFYGNKAGIYSILFNLVYMSFAAGIALFTGSSETDISIIQYNLIISRIIGVSAISLIIVLTVSYYRNYFKITIHEAEKSEQKYKQLSDVTLEGIIIHSNGIVHDMNLSLAKIFGYRLEELQGLALNGMIKKLIHKDSHNTIADKIKLDYSGAYEVIGIKKDGSLFPVELEGRNLKTDSGGKKRVVAVRDITEKKAAEESLQKQTEELRLAKEKAEESDILKSEFIRNISHEIRTPINGILGFSDFLKNPGLTETQKNKYIEIIQSSSNQLLRIIDDILEISELETSQVVPEEETVCINELLYTLISMYKSEAESKGITLLILTGLSDRESTVITDKDRTTRIISNLIENALKFIKEGSVETGCRLKENDGESILEIYVKDTGIGIEPGTKDIIFKYFSQGDKKLSRKAGGLGLGLAIAKENAELLGGSIDFISKPGEGSTFSLYLPYKPVDSKEEKNEDIKIPFEPEKEYLILIAEDEYINYMYLATVLSKLPPVKTIHAKDGKESVDLCRENPRIDLIFMDLKMPVMGGFKATEVIRESFPDVPIIIQTAYSGEEEMERAFSAGANDFISKPIRRRTLNGILKKYLGISLS